VYNEYNKVKQKKTLYAYYAGMQRKNKNVYNIDYQNAKKLVGFFQIPHGGLGHRCWTLVEGFSSTRTLARFPRSAVGWHGGR